MLRSSKPLSAVTTAVQVAPTEIAEQLVVAIESDFERVAHDDGQATELPGKALDVERLPEAFTPQGSSVGQQRTREDDVVARVFFQASVLQRALELAVFTQVSGHRRGVGGA